MSNLSLTQTADIISAVEFDQTGDYLATGDKGGRVVLFERNEDVSSLSTISEMGNHASHRSETDMFLYIKIRKLAVNTSSIPSFNHTNQSSIV